MYFVHPQISFKDFLRLFFCFWQKKGPEKIFESFFPERKFYFVDMGRTAFRIIVEKLNLKNSEILLPAFICDIFFPLLKEYQISPVFLDINLKTFNIEISQIKDKITPKTRAILISHTFGLPINFKELLSQIPSNCFLIEDCAHAFGAKYQDKFVGNFGNVAFFSLYKQFPIARGGLLVCPKDWQIFLKKSYFNFRDFLSFLNSFPIFAFFFKKYGGEISPKIIRKEKKKEFLALNSFSLSLFFHFFQNFEEKLKERKRLALLLKREIEKLGFEVQDERNNVFTFFSTLVPPEFKEKRDLIVQELKKKKIFCTRIWHTPIILNSEAQSFWKINPKDFPNTLEAAKRIVNFPLQNYYNEKDVFKIVFTLQEILRKLK